MLVSSYIVTYIGLNNINFTATRLASLARASFIIVFYGLELEAVRSRKSLKPLAIALVASVKLQLQALSLGSL